MNATPTTSTEKGWSTFRVRAALAGHSAVKDERGWITVGRWGRTQTFHSLVRIGPRASGLPASEVQEIAAARVAGHSDDQIKALVLQIHERRKLATPKIGGAA